MPGIQKMQMKRLTYGLTLLCALLIAQQAYASRVAVVIDMPDGPVTRCVPAIENENGYLVLEDAEQNAVWSYYGQALGHGLCGINGIGCPASNCYCDPSAYWNYYVKEPGGDWEYSQTGFDGGSSCSEHYCASDGDMLGLAYGNYGSEPSGYSFEDVCCEVPGDTIPCGSVSVGEVVLYINSWTEGKADLGEVVDLIKEWSSA
jgi:hypothetical protein